MFHKGEARKRREKNKKGQWTKRVERKEVA